MAKGGKPRPTEARFALSANLRHLMDTFSKGFDTGINAPELEKGVEGRVSAKTIRRMLDPYSDTSPNLDSVDDLAAFFEVKTWELFRPRRLDARISGSEPLTPEQSVDSLRFQKRNKR